MKKIVLATALVALTSFGLATTAHAEPQALPMVVSQASTMTQAVQNTELLGYYQATVNPQL